MAAKTAVDFLVEQLFELRNPTLNQIEIIKNSKEIEKDNIENAYIQGFCHCDKKGVMDFEKYYKKTFKSCKDNQ